jgi:hypothetical protein
MAINAIDGVATTTLSAVDGRTLSTLSAINGQAFTVPYTPSSAPNIWAWSEPSLLGLANNDPISTLTDQTGNSRNWTSTATERPLYKVNIFNGSTVGAALLDGDNDNFAVPNASALTAIHMFQVVKLSADPPINSLESGFHTWTGDGGNNAHYPFTDGVIYDSFASTARKTTADPGNMAAAHVYDVFSGSGNWRNRFNGTTVFSTGTNTVSIPATGKWGQNFNADNMHGWMGGIYIFSAEVTGTDRTNLINYINTKFGTSST